MLHVLNFVLGVAIAYWIYNDAREKKGYDTGRSLLWALAAVPFTFVTLLVYLLFAKPLTEAPARDVVDVKGEVKILSSCPGCGRTVQEDFKICPYCGQVLHPCCQACGREIPRDARLCPYCGAAMSQVGKN